MLKKTLVIATLCAAGLVLWPSGGRAQCSARHVLQNATIPKTDPIIPTSAGLDVADCGIGDLAEEILARPAFTLASTKTDVDGAEETPWD
jgi:hypothetical protein